jgi:hypothetical protein
VPVDKDHFGDSLTHKGPLLNRGEVKGVSLL